VRLRPCVQGLHLVRPMAALGCTRGVDVSGRWPGEGASRGRHAGHVGWAPFPGIGRHVLPGRTLETTPAFYSSMLCQCVVACSRVIYRLLVAMPGSTFLLIYVLCWRCVAVVLWCCGGVLLCCYGGVVLGCCVAVVLWCCGGVVLGCCVVVWCLLLVSQGDVDQRLLVHDARERPSLWCSRAPSRCAPGLPLGLRAGERGPRVRPRRSRDGSLRTRRLGWMPAPSTGHSHPRAPWGHDHRPRSQSQPQSQPQPRPQPQPHSKSQAQAQPQPHKQSPGCRGGGGGSPSCCCRTRGKRGGSWRRRAARSLGSGGTRERGRGRHRGRGRLQAAGGGQEQRKGRGEGRGAAGAGPWCTCGRVCRVRAPGSLTRWWGRACPRRDGWQSALQAAAMSHAFFC